MNTERLRQANAILKVYASQCRLEWDHGIYIAWTDHNDKPHRLRWFPNSRGSDFPTISDRVPFGGTCCCATMELTRWVRGLPVRPLSMWQGFCSKTVGMNPEALRLAIEFGWPEQVRCVFCRRLVGNGVPWDHYDLKGYAVGPGCWYTEGCKGQPVKKQAA